MATAADALEALLSMHSAQKKSPSPVQSSSNHLHPAVPIVPNPLDHTQPHIIEGDMQTSADNRQALFGSGAMSAFSALAVPNPLLATSAAEVSPMLHPSPPPVLSSAAAKTLASDASGLEDKIRDALNSKPQRGKKRQNLNELEREELTRSRNREHARNTR